MILSSVVVAFAAQLLQICECINMPIDIDQALNSRKRIKARYFSSEEELRRFLSEYNDYVYFDEPDIDEKFGPPNPAILVDNNKQTYVMGNIPNPGTFDHNQMLIDINNNHGTDETKNGYIPLPGSQVRLPPAPEDDMKEILRSRVQLQKDIIAERNREKLRQMPKNQAQGTIIYREPKNSKQKS